MQDVKRIRVLADMGNIEESCIWGLYWIVFPWRPPGNRLLLSSGVFGNEKETTAFFKKAKAKYVPITATDLLETDDESTFFEAKEAQNNSKHTEERAGTSKRRVASELTKFSTRITNGDDSGDSVERSIVVSGGKPDTVSVADDDDETKLLAACVQTSWIIIGCNQKVYRFFTVYQRYLNNSYFPSLLVTFNCYYF